jgi:hypothetical protein
MSDKEILEKIAVEMSLSEQKMYTWITAIQAEIARSEHNRFLIYHQLNKDKLKDEGD